jgi:Tol biopolymer transport system component
VVASLIAAVAISTTPVPVLVFRRSNEIGSEVVGMTSQGDFVILRGASSDAFKAAISPDGSKIAFIVSKRLYVAPLRVEAYETARRVSARRWVSDVRRVRRDEWTGATLFADSATTGPSWAPDGSAIFYARPHSDSGVREKGDIMKVEVRRDGSPGSLVQLTNIDSMRHRDAIPYCSPDGRTILFGRDADPRGLYSVSVRGGATTNLELGIGWDALAWFPDGRKVIGSRTAGSGSGLFTFGFPKTGTPQKVHYSEPGDASPQVSPDGMSLAFARPMRVSRALTVPKLAIGPLGDEGEGIRRMPALITPAATSTAEYPLQWLALTPPR